MKKVLYLSALAVLSAACDSGVSLESIPQNRQKTTESNVSASSQALNQLTEKPAGKKPSQKSVSTSEAQELLPLGERLSTLVTQRNQLEQADRSNFNDLDQIIFSNLLNDNFDALVELLENTLQRLNKREWSPEDDPYRFKRDLDFLVRVRAGDEYPRLSLYEWAYISVIVALMDEALNTDFISEDLAKRPLSWHLFPINSLIATTQASKARKTEAEFAIQRWISKSIFLAKRESDQGNRFLEFLDDLENEIQRDSESFQGGSRYPYNSEFILLCLGTLIKSYSEIPEHFSEERSKVYELVFEALMPWSSELPDAVNENLIPIIPMMGDPAVDLLPMLTNHRNLYGQLLFAAQNYGEAYPGEIDEMKLRIERVESAILKINNENL